VTTLHDLGGVLGHFLLGSHNFVVTALDLCVKSPVVWLEKDQHAIFEHGSVNDII
jgi:hypothetical protein